MKITYNAYHAVGSWRWDLQPPAEGEGATKTEPEIDDEADSGSEEEEDDEDEEEDEVCGICQLEFESSCPGCKVPGDDCPLMWGQCTHVFHMHCLLKWLNTASSKEQCPLDRRPWGESCLHSGLDRMRASELDPGGLVLYGLEHVHDIWADSDGFTTSPCFSCLPPHRSVPYFAYWNRQSRPNDTPRPTVLLFRVPAAIPGPTGTITILAL
ncbi:anaphase-promoting complex subunit 11 RING-H2 finger-domain-containing protein [Filobasidium floriforme]|uniref:anaphase-promoting complex subunit 11 RING-H2 finger-domain-containing protein n=1 Tax=Filobasidium floriforme TaxID=5210 RepID=UPI001E8DB374|nr:anaphase-promoting complex subunit 11 RING-H2 finger-domain-containing protein [Filobasidium floriforme]KAH8090778.1 anaphase-promoting complex subunit 11 RING-H2 finger-domain-containing protein [Filobasidium floriforme]